MLTRSSLIRAITKKIPKYKEEDVADAVKTLIELIKECVCEQKKVEIRKFGSIQLRHHPNLVCRDPKTGNVLNKMGRTQIKFRYGKDLYQILNKDIEENAG